MKKQLPFFNVETEHGGKTFRIVQASVCDRKERVEVSTHLDDYTAAHRYIKQRNHEMKTTGAMP